VAGPDPPSFLFVDCDRFYFAVEAAEAPWLQGDPRPVIIGHDPRTYRRGIVTTANDAARKLGINSGLSSAVALRLAPNAVFLPPRHELYSRYSRRVMAVLEAASPLVEQRSIDEAACEWPAGFVVEPAVALRELVMSETGISISLGIATSPLVAKMASEHAKEQLNHVCVVPPGQEAAFLAPLPVRALVGVGPKAEARLKELRIETIGALAAQALGDVVDHFGRAYGRYLHDASQGIAEATLHTDRDYKSVSAENTFAEDTLDRREIWQELRTQAGQVSARLVDKGLQAAEVAIKLRYANWETLTRQMRLAAPTADAELLAAGAAALMRRHWQRTRAIRLIGLRAARLTPVNEDVAQLRLLD
jgi:DNA polymerase-4